MLPENLAIFWDFADSKSAVLTGTALPANSTYTLPVNFDQGAGMVTLFASNLVSFSLQTPSGALITPVSAASNPDIQYGQLGELPLTGSGWTQQYALVNQPSGIYTVVVSAPDAVQLTVLAQMSSTISLNYQSNKATYSPNENVVITATLQNAASSGASVNGNVFLADGTAQSIVFNDAGIDGDIAANDGIFTSQFSAPSPTYYPNASTPYVRYEIQAQANGVVRTALDTITVMPDTARIVGATGDFTTDDDADGLINSLGITVSLQVTHTGQFQLSGLLTDQTGAAVIGQALIPGGLVLPAGSHSVALIFDGVDIRRSKINGPYRLSSVLLQDNSSSGIGLQSLDNLYLTSFYSATQFEQPPLSIISSTEQLIDTDNDGLAEYLQIVIQPQGLTAGNYQVSGDLVTADGQYLGYSDDKSFLNADQLITFTFHASSIIHTFANGLYRLTNLVIARSNYGGDPIASQIPTRFFYDVHTTAAYTPTQFEGVLTTLYGPVCTPLNRTGWATSASVNAANSSLAVDGITTTV